MRFGFWNVRGWHTDHTSDNYQVRHKCIASLGLDIIGIAESHLVGSNVLSLPGFKWFGHNRSVIHPRARCGSGGVGLLVRDYLFNFYNVHVIDHTMEGALWIKFSAVNAAVSFIICVCYLPPERSSRAVDAQYFYDELLRQLYSYQQEEIVIICGDFNSRIASKPDFIEGVDDVIKRAPLDNAYNSHGDRLLEFLLSTNCCVMNGRSGVNDFTCISNKGLSVVDYCIVPHEHVQPVNNFAVRRARFVFDNAGWAGIMDPSHSIPDHSILTWGVNLLGNRYENESSGQVNGTRHVFDKTAIDKSIFKTNDGQLLLEEIHSRIQSVENIEQLNKVYEDFCSDVNAKVHSE